MDDNVVEFPTQEKTDVVEEVSSEEKTEEEVKISKEEIDKLKKDQEKNSLIKENKESFIGICNKVLDYLYDVRDRDDNNENSILEENDRKDLLSLADGIELILRKIKIDAPLVDLEFARLCLCCQYVGEDMRNQAVNFSYASNMAFEFVKKLSE